MQNMIASLASSSCSLWLLSCLVFIFDASAFGNRKKFDCSQNSAVMSHVKYVNDGRDPIMHTVISTSIKKGQTLCHELVPMDSQQFAAPDESVAPQFKRFVAIELIDVWQEFEIKNAYNFSTPILEATCFCDCPDIIEKCNRKHQYNGNIAMDSITVKQYTAGHEAIGCSFRETADVCCDITMTAERDASHLYRAVNVLNPITMYKFQYTVIDGNYQTLFKEEFQMGTAAGTKQITNGSISIRGISVPTPLISGWYFVHPTTKSLMTNIPINDDHGQDIKKLGWFKILNNGHVNNVDPSVIEKAFQPFIDNCGSDQYRWRFTGNFWKARHDENVHLTLGNPAVEFFRSTVRQIRVSSRSVSVRYVDYSPITIEVQFNFQADVLFHFDSSSFVTFSAQIELDEFSNRVLTITFSQAQGKILGRVKREQKSESISLFVPSKTPLNVTRKYRLTSDFDGESEVCFRNQLQNSWQCKTATYSAKPLTEVIFRDGVMKGVDVAKTEVKNVVLETMGEWWTNIKEFTQGFPNIIDAIIGIVSALAAISFLLLAVWSLRIVMPRRAKKRRTCAIAEKCVLNLDSGDNLGSGDSRLLLRPSLAESEA